MQNKDRQLALITVGIVVSASALLAYIVLANDLSLNKWIVLFIYIASGPFYALGSSLTSRPELISVIFLSAVALFLVYLFYRAFKVKSYLLLLLLIGIWLFVGYAFAVLVWI